MSVVGVVGGGPAGSTFAARMAQLGHEVWLVERARFPRRHLGEALTPGVLPLLEMTGAHASIGSARFRRVRRVHVEWELGPQVREEAHERGLIVDRGEFDRLLIEHARKLGVRLLQPATVRQRDRRGAGWHVVVDSDDGVVPLRADLLADATGRATGRSTSRTWTGPSTLALHAYWRAADLPTEPRIEAGADAWYWGVPLPDGTYNTLVFADAACARAIRGTLAERFRELLSRSRLFAQCRNPELASPISAINATPYVDQECASPTLLKVGDAALALDPLSSSGVQKAIQGALSAAIVANTLLRRADSTQAAQQFYQSSLEESSERHRRWAAGHYGRVARQGGGTFWQERAGGVADDPPDEPSVAAAASLLPSATVGLSRQLEFVDLPCIEGDFVTVKPALRHPTISGAIAYLGGHALAPLLRELPAGLTPMQIAQSWSDRIPLDRGLAITGWMLDRGLLVSHGAD
jgi:flavin-dependent dehydrogenase